MAYEASLSTPDIELSKYQELLVDDVHIVKQHSIQVIDHCIVEAPTETFIEYTVVYENGDQNLKVWRRYSDFDWLMKYLYQKYPFNILPPIPPKRYFSTTDKFSRAFIDKRQVSLSIMMQRLCNFNQCIMDERTQLFLKEGQKDFDHYKSKHKNNSLLTQLRLSFRQLYFGSLSSFGINDAWKDSETTSYIQTMNRRALDRSLLVSILDSIDSICDHWEVHSYSLLWFAQNCADLVLIMPPSDLTTCLDGTAQLYFNLSSEGKLHYSFLVDTLQPIFLEYLAYNDSVINSIKRRNRTKAIHYSKTQSLKLVDSRTNSRSIEQLPRGSHYDRLTKEAIILEDDLSSFDAIFLSDLSVWQRQRSKDIARCLNVIVTSNIKYHRSCLDLCKHVLNKMSGDLLHP